ncbi:uncharacterized protein LOC141685309 [Apium graveolens]|uniref:uncharacterized protein LOC141685309 n=1 Tax=Apium graveolens TaxID=4045 RepID=UPI003D796E67
MEECSVVLQQKLPPKVKDPGSFTIPCIMGNLFFDKFLCDLGASINLVPLSVFKKVGLPEPKPVIISLQLADRSITYHRGVVEDVLVKVYKLIFPTDLVIPDFEEDKKIPIILGRTFLPTGRTLIDVQKGELIMRVQGQDVTFNVFNAMKFPTDEEECFKVELVDSIVTSELDQILRTDALERALTGWRDVHQFVSRCDRYQRVGNMSKRDGMPLNVLLEVEIFNVWGIDFMGPFVSSCNNQYFFGGRLCLVYGKAYHLPAELEHRADWALKKLNLDMIVGEKRMLQLNELDEFRL